MSDIFRFLSDHPLTAMAACFILLLILYFFCKRLIKLALVVLIVALAIGGYFYFQYPDQRPADMKEALEKARTGAGKAVEKGKEALEKGQGLAEKGKGFIDKGREIADRGESFLDKAVKKGKAVLDVLKKAAREIGKIFTGE